MIDFDIKIVAEAGGVIVGVGLDLVLDGEDSGVTSDNDNEDDEGLKELSSGGGVEEVDDDDVGVGRGGGGGS